MLVADVIKATAAVAGVSVETLLAPCRERKLAHTRQLGMLVATRCTKATINEIGRRFGRRDHTTISHGELAAQARLAAGDETSHSELARLLELLGVAELPLHRQSRGLRHSCRRTLDRDIRMAELRLERLRSYRDQLEGDAA
jgi:hypothetical protein